MWTEEYTVLCRQDPDVVAVYGSGTELALLLRHTLVPLSEERRGWLAQTRRVARRIVGGLRTAGFRGRVRVLQWLPLAEAAEIMHRWPRHYDGDPDRRARHVEIAAGYAADQRFLASRVNFLHRERILSGSSAPFVPRLHAVREWYRRVVPTWLGAEPTVRRTLVLKTHRWVMERVLLSTSEARPAALMERAPDGRGVLADMLAAAVPPSELGVWQSWIELVVGDLRRALSWPVDERSEAWVRWLFLIPLCRDSGAAKAQSS